MKKKNILSLTVLSSLMAIAGFSSFNRVSADSVGVHAAETTSTNMPTGWEASGVTADNTISPFKDPTQVNSILLKRTVAEGALMARSTLTTVKPNTYYNFSVNAKTTGASQLKIRVVEYKDGTTALKATEVIKVTTVTGDWASRPGMLKTTAETNGVVIEIEATGTGEIYASKLFVHEGVAPTGVMTGRTKYFDAPSGNPDTSFANSWHTPINYLDINSGLLSGDAATGFSSMKLTPGRCVMLNFDDYKITGKFTLRFKYKYVGPGNNIRLVVKLDGFNKDGKRVYQGDDPFSGWTPFSRWYSYSYEFSAKPTQAEPAFVAIYSVLQDASGSGDAYYLIDDVEVLDEKGNNLVEDGGFELKEKASVNTMGLATMPEGINEVTWGGAFDNVPVSSFIDDGFNGTRAIHLDSRKSLGISLPKLPNDSADKTFTLSFKYRTTQAPLLWLKIDGFNLDNKRIFYATEGSGLNNTNGEWVAASYQFKTRINATENNATSTEFMIFNAVTPIDLDDISVKDNSGTEYLYGGNFEPVMAGGGAFVNNANAYLDENGGVVYSAMQKISTNATAKESYLSVNPYSLGIDTANSGVKYTISFEYLGGRLNSSVGITDTQDWIIPDGLAGSTKWTSHSVDFVTKTDGTWNTQDFHIYGNHYGVRNCYFRNFSVKDADGNEYFHPLSNGTSILPQGSFLINDKEAVDEFVAAYITGEAAEDYTAIPETDRAGKCQNKLAKAEGALKRMTASQQELFRTSDDYAAARTAMDMWRTVSSKTSIGIFGGNAASNSTTILVCTLLAVSAVAITSFVLIRKKKHN